MSTAAVATNDDDLDTFRLSSVYGSDPNNVSASGFADLAVIAATRKRKLANHTYLEVGPEGPFGPLGIRLHSTEILKFFPDGRIVLNSGGWQTVTTKERMNRYLPHPWSIYSEKGDWFLCREVGRSGWIRKATGEKVSYAERWKVNSKRGEFKYVHGLERFAFQKHMTIQPDGTVHGAGTDPSIRAAFDKKLHAYARAYTNRFINGKMKAPDFINPTCETCSLWAKYPHQPQPPSEHFFAHIDAKEYPPYFVPKLLDTGRSAGGAIIILALLDQWSKNVSTQKPLRDDTYPARSQVRVAIHKLIFDNLSDHLWPRVEYLHKNNPVQM